MKRLFLPLAFLLLATPALAQTAPQADQVDKTVRASASALAQAQTLMLQIPDLVAQIDALRAQNAALQKEVAAAKKAAKPAAKPPAHATPVKKPAGTAP